MPYMQPDHNLESIAFEQGPVLPALKAYPVAL